MKLYKLPIDNIIDQLGYRASSNLFFHNQIENSCLSPHSKRIIKEINPYAVFVLNDAPFVLFFDKTLNNDASFKNVSRQIWNAQIPVAIFCDQNSVRIFNGMSLNMSDYTLVLIKYLFIRNVKLVYFILYIEYTFKSNLQGDFIMNACQLTAYITAIANALSSKLSIEETTLLATVLVQLGDTLATIATGRAICEAEDDKYKS